MNIHKRRTIRITNKMGKITKKELEDTLRELVHITDCEDWEIKEKEIKRFTKGIWKDFVKE